MIVSSVAHSATNIIASNTPLIDKTGIDMPYPLSVVLFHDATGTRDGDIERAKYLAARSDKTKYKFGI